MSKGTSLPALSIRQPYAWLVVKRGALRPALGGSRPFGSIPHEPCGVMLAPEILHRACGESPVCDRGTRGRTVVNTNGIKDIENRSWRTKYQGPHLVHAGLNSSLCSEDFIEECESSGRRRLPVEFDFGGIIAYVELIDCVRRHDSLWNEHGSSGWVLAHARPLRFHKCKGALSLFSPTLARKVRSNA
jgi:hypothetical protein